MINMIKIKYIISIISDRVKVSIASTSSSLMKPIFGLSEILNLDFTRMLSILSQVAPKYSSQSLLPCLSANNRLLPETHDLFYLDTTLSQVANTYSSQILLPSSSQNNRTLPEIKHRRY